MTSVVSIQATQTADDPNTWTDEQLVAAYRSALAERGANTEKMARIWTTMKKRGLAHLVNDSLSFWFESVALGNLRGQLVDWFHGDFVVLRKLARISLHEQDRVLGNEEFAVLSANGSITRVKGLALKAAHVHRLIVDNKLATIAEQQAAASAPKKSQPVPPPTTAEPKKYTPTLDRERVSMRVGQVVVQIPKFLEVLASNKPDKPPPLDLHGDEVTKAGCEVVGVMLWNEEKERLDRAARRAGLPTMEMIRKAINAYLGALLDG